MGKSLICKRIAFKWFNSQTGAVFYRGGNSEQPFKNRADLCHAIESAQTHSGGHVLIVVEDATRDESKAIFDVMEEFREKPNVNVSFLLDTRQYEWREFLSKHNKYHWLQNLDLEYIKNIGVPELNVDTVVDAVSTYNSISEDSIPMRKSKVIFENLNNEDNAPNNLFGDILVLTHKILSKGSLDTKSPLLKDASDIHQELLECVDYGGETASLEYQISVLINILNASEIPIRRAYLYALAENKKNCVDIDRILTENDYINEVMVNTNKYEKLVTDRRHPSWSLAFVYHVISSKNESEISAFKNTLHHSLCNLAQLANSDEKLQMILDYTDGKIGDISKLDDLVPGSEDKIEQILKQIYRFGKRNPVLYDIYTSPDIGEEITDPEKFPESFREYSRFKLLQIRASMAEKATSNFEKYSVTDAKHAFEDLIHSDIPNTDSEKKEFKIVAQSACRDYAKFTEEIREYEESAKSYYKFIKISKDLNHYLSLDFYHSFNENALRCGEFPMAIDVSEFKNYLDDKNTTVRSVCESDKLKILGDLEYLSGNQADAMNKYEGYIDITTSSNKRGETYIPISEILIDDIEKMGKETLCNVVANLNRASEEYTNTKSGAALIISSHIGKIHAMNGDINEAVQSNDLAIINSFEMLTKFVNELPRKIRRNNKAITSNFDGNAILADPDALDTLNLLLAQEQHKKVYDRFNTIREYFKNNTRM